MSISQDNIRMSITISKDTYVGLQLEGRPSRVAARRVEQFPQLQVADGLRSDCVDWLASYLCVACYQGNNWTEVNVAMRLGDAALSRADVLIADTLRLVLFDDHNRCWLRDYRSWCADNGVDPHC